MNNARIGKALDTAELLVLAAPVSNNYTAIGGTIYDTFIKDCSIHLTHAYQFKFVNCEFVDCTFNTQHPIIFEDCIFSIQTSRSHRELLPQFSYLRDCTITFSRNNDITLDLVNLTANGLTVNSSDFSGSLDLTFNRCTLTTFDMCVINFSKCDLTLLGCNLTAVSLLGTTFTSIYAKDCPYPDVTASPKAEQLCSGDPIFKCALPSRLSNAGIIPEVGGFYFYKYFGLYRQPTPNWCISVGSVITDPDLVRSCEQRCAPGINGFSNLDTLKKFSVGARLPNHYYKLFVDYKDFTDVIVPDTSIVPGNKYFGHIRVGKATIVGKYKTSTLFR